MTFRNIAGIIRINVTGIPDGLGIREIQASAATSLTGSYTVDTSGDDFEAVSSEPGAANGVRLTAMDGGSLAAGAYNLVVLPGTYSELKVTVILTDGSYVAKGGADNAKEAVIPANGGINISIDASNPTKVSNGLVNYFKNGEDLYIGGKIYNKSQFADDGIVDYSGTTSSIYNTSTYGDGKIIFVRPDAAVKNLGNANNIVVVGTDPQDRSLVNKTSCNNLFTEQDVNRLILANINRNILLADMQTYALGLKSKGETLFQNRSKRGYKNIPREFSGGGLLVISGFYGEDVPLLKKRAEECGLRFAGKMSRDNWTALLFNRI